GGRPAAAPSRRSRRPGGRGGCWPARAPKRDAIMTAARVVFGRESYLRTSIDAIPGEAGVSTRTIYNHFETTPNTSR
ncbi:MAG TPA: helix-turn-helix domain-containing protein, partial [Pseudonocardia sp.]|nr:helix-turn-helix domain-containing protein [Pseudonocardia sp.]